MTTKSQSSDAAADRVIVSKRIIAAPREVLFKAFSDPDQLMLWWGPLGFTSTFHVFDFRPGGTWRFTMRGPNGAEYPNEHNFTEVVPPERIVYQHVQPPLHSFTMTITFADKEGKTELTWLMRFESAAEVAKLKSFIAGANEQNFDRLEAHLAALN